MFKRQVILWVMILITSFQGAIAFAQENRYKDTIPPEILRQFDPLIVKGTRPKIVRITTPMIWGLRDKPDQGGDVYSFDLDVNKLSTVQMNTLREWVRSGHKILFWGHDDAARHSTIFNDVLSFHIPRTRSDKDRTRPQLSVHPVNTDVSDLDFRWTSPGGSYSGYALVTKYPPDSEVIVSKRNGIVAGRVPYGRGSIYFALMANHWHRGKDRDRWTLNFNQFVLGYRVPGSFETHLSDSVATVGQKQGEFINKILLKNGDTVSGKLVTAMFNIKTSYAELVFELKQINSRAKINPRPWNWEKSHEIG